MKCHNGGPRPSIFELELPLSNIYVNHSNYRFEMRKSFFFFPTDEKRGPCSLIGCQNIWNPDFCSVFVRRSIIDHSATSGHLKSRLVRYLDPTEKGKCLKNSNLRQPGKRWTEWSERIRCFRFGPFEPASCTVEVWKDIISCYNKKSITNILLSYLSICKNSNLIV